MRTIHQMTAFQKPLFLHDSSVAITPLSSLRSERITRSYLATVLRTSAQIQSYGWTSDMSEPLGEIHNEKTEGKYEKA